MPEPQGNAPVEGNKDRTNFTKAGIKPGIPADRNDQTDNTAANAASSNSMKNISSNSKFNKEMND